MTSKKQTAVEWLISKTSKNCFNKKEIEQAIEIEKKQIITAYRVGKAESHINLEKLSTGEDYYNQNFKK